MNGANIANFSDEFGQNSVSKVMNGRGGDNSEEPANKARHSNWTFEKSTDSSLGSASDNTKDSISQNVKSSGSKGISITKEYGTDNFN